VIGAAILKLVDGLVRALVHFLDVGTHERGILGMLYNRHPARSDIRAVHTLTPPPYTTISYRKHLCVACMSN
jgi:hypothetical protein